MLFAAAASLVVAAEPSPAPAPTEDSIAATRRDFDAIKAARNPAEAPKGDVPHFSMPDMQTAVPGEPMPWLTKREKDATAEKKSANWLVDAMMNPDKSNPNGPSRADPRKPTGKSAENRALAGLEIEKDDFSPRSERTSGKAPEGSGNESSSDKDRPQNANAFNPFATYMASWMTPQDYALLRPVVATGHADAASVIGSGSSVTPTSVALAAANPGGDLISSLSGTAKPASPPATPMENPYLQAVSLPPAPVVSTPVPPPSTPTTAPSAVFAPPPPAEQKPVVPDFVKPTDDKYYKPLKRF